MGLDFSPVGGIEFQFELDLSRLVHSFVRLTHNATPLTPT